MEEAVFVKRPQTTTTTFTRHDLHYHRLICAYQRANNELKYASNMYIPLSPQSL